MESVAYGFWLHKMSGSALEANRFACDYNLAHHPVPTTPSSVSTRASAGLTSFGYPGPAPALDQPHHHRSQPHHHRSRTPRTPAEPRLTNGFPPPRQQLNTRSSGTRRHPETTLVPSACTASAHSTKTVHRLRRRTVTKLGG
ncbi:DUF6417 family protein [Streptomyces sp. NPDC000658]|uniref:DUF6417 family protein n=1 Tax=Streptomyces sp. NPDC000658 TaxID=3154266 RepID=UPI00331E03CB